MLRLCIYIDIYQYTYGAICIQLMLQETILLTIVLGSVYIVYAWEKLQNSDPFAVLHCYSYVKWEDYW